MTKYSFPLLLSFLLTLLLNTHSKAQIVYPDKAVFDINEISFLIDFELYNSTYQDFTFGPDGSVQLITEGDSLVATFGEHAFTAIIKAASIEDFKDPEKVSFYVTEDVNSGHYKGTDDPDPGNYDYKIWPHGNTFIGNDGDLYSVAYLEFLGWEVWGYDSPECPNPNVGTLAEECWMSALILVKSTDGGVTWDKAGITPSEYLVASSPYKYREQENSARHGVFFLHNGLFKIGNYYYLDLEFWGENFKIASYARTNDITDASSWRYFDGEDFTIPNVNPYLEIVSDPSSHLPPSRDNYRLDFNTNKELVEGLSYSSYFNKYIYIRERVFFGNPEVKPGIYYHLSDDGFNWSGPSLILPYKGNFDKATLPEGGQRYEIVYPSLVDQVNPGGNIGEHAYLLWVNFQSISSSGYNASLNGNRDVEILPISFKTHEVISLEVTHTNLNIPEDSNAGDGYCDNGYGRCSLITAITESESRPPWLDSSVPLTITIGDSAPDTLTEDYLARIKKRTIIDGTAHQDFSANSLDTENGWNGTYGVHIKPGFVFESGEGHKLKGIDVQSVDVGGGEDGSQTSSVTITQSKINTLTLNNAHTSGVQVGGFTADSANIIGAVIFKGTGNVVRGNHIGHDGNSLMNNYGVGMGFANTLESNVIVGKDNGILINVTGDNNKILNNHIGYLPWSNSSLASQGAGIKLTSASNNHIVGNTIKFTNSDQGEAALFLNGADNNKIYSNVISNNSGIGIHVSGTSKGNFVGDSDKGNTISSNDYGVSFLVNTETGNPVIGNTIFDNINGSIGQYSHIQKLESPTLYSAYVNSTNDSLIINHSSISETSSENFLVDIFSNSSSPAIPQGENIIISKLSITSDDLSTKTLAIPYTGSSNVFISTTFTDDRLVTSEFSNVVQLLPETSSPSASYSFSSLIADHTSNWYSEHTLQITNNGSTDLVLQLEEDLGWVNLDLNLDPDGKYVSFTVASGETKNLTIYFDSRDLSDEIGSHTGSITINSNEIRPTLRSLPIEITFDTGETDWLTLSEDSVSLFYKIPNQDSTITKTLSLTNNNSDAVNWRMSKNQGWIMGLSPESGTVQSGASTDVTITFVLKANDPEGSKRATLVLFAGTVPENETATEIPFVVNMVPKNVNDVVVSPDSIEVITRQPFTNIEITKNISISNFGDPNLQWRINDNQPWIAPESESGTISSGTQVIPIVLHINSTDPIGPKTGLLTVYTGYEGGQETSHEVPITVQITANKPIISFNVDTLKATFQRPTENSTGTASFVLYNQSSDSINWLAFKNQGWITGLEPAGGKIKDSVEVTVSFRLRPNDPIGFKNAIVTTAAFFDGSEEQTQAELPVRLMITDGGTNPLPNIEFIPAELYVSDTLNINENFEEFVSLSFNNLGSPGVNFQYVQTLSSFAVSSPFNGQFNTTQDISLKFNFSEVQENIYIDTVITYRFFYPQEEVDTKEIPLTIDIVVTDGASKNILVDVKPDSIMRNVPVDPGQTLIIKESISLINQGEGAINYGVLLPEQVQGKTALNGTLTDSLNIPFEIVLENIVESFSVEEEIITRFWYDDDKDSIITIPLDINVIYEPNDPIINVIVEPNTFNLQQTINLNDTLFVKEELLIYNLSESEINWEVNVPFDQSNTGKLTGTLIDSLNIPIEFSITDITTSFVFEDKIETRFWYSENNDTTIVIPLSINIDVVNVSIDADSDLPNEITLYQNYPNPFNPSTQISFALPKSEHVQLSVFNVSGQMIVELINDQMPAGVHQVTFDAQGLSSGTYIYQLKTSDGVLNKKLLLIK